MGNACWLRQNDCDLRPKWFILGRPVTPFVKNVDGYERI